MFNVPKRAQPFVITICLAALVLCGASIIRGCGDNSGEFTKEHLQRLESAIGYSVQEIVDRLGDKTNVLLVSLEVAGSEGLAESREVAKTVLKKGGKQIAAEEVINPIGEGQFFNPVNWAMSWGEYNELVTRNSGCDAVVSLAGAPWLGEGDEVILPDSYPGLYVAFSPGRQPALEELFEEKILEVAVVRSPAPGGGAEETPRDEFNRTFLVVTADSEELPVFQAMP